MTNPLELKWTHRSSSDNSFSTLNTNDCYTVFLGKTNLPILLYTSTNRYYGILNIAFYFMN